MMMKRKKKKLTHATALRKADQMFSRLRRTQWALETGSLENDGFFRCVTCGRVIAIKNGDCGHCVPRGVMETRFMIENTAGQCGNCNRFGNGQTIRYLESIKHRYGQGVHDKLVDIACRKPVKKWTTPELYEMAKGYQKECLRLWSEAGEVYPWAVEKFKKVSCGQ